MPLYEYRCKSCGHQFEKIQSFSAPEEKECPQCHGEVERLLSPPAIQFKGSGWYVSDYAKKGGSMKASAEGAKDGAKSEGSSSDKPAASTDSSSGSSTAPSSSTNKPSKSE
ncbi:MAG TPA: zinc ribbon domain-containing protein [Acidobacteriaceae bacterium]|nr:zinc ribbon domain-containing protein [Acidobacteriaceae bacterium]